VKTRDLVAQRLTPEGLADARTLKEALAPHGPPRKGPPDNGPASKEPAAKD